MPLRRRKMFSKKQTVKHSLSLVDNIGQGTNAVNLIVLKTSGGPRSVSGAPQTIQSSASTDENCRTGDTCKFINLYAQIGPRSGVGAATDRVGWYEWAFVCVRENETQVPSTRLGLQTLGDICTNMYRGECIYSGMIPVGEFQPVTLAASIKIPKHKQNIKLGDEWRFITFFRAVSSTSVSTTALRAMKSCNFKVAS